MKRPAPCILLALPLAWPATSVAAEAGPIEPSSSWTLEGTEESCALLRNFGSGNRFVQLQVESYGSLDRFEAVLIGNLVPRPTQLRPQVRYWFDADTSERSKTAIGSRDNKVSYVRFDADFRPNEPEPDLLPASVAERLELEAERRPPIPGFESQVAAMTVAFSNRSRLELRLGSMAAPLSALRDCVARLHQHWGLDAERQAGLTRLPVPSAAAISFMQTQYPATMIRRGTNAYIPVRVIVDAEGRPAECVVQLPAVDVAFKRAVCSGLNHRFEPALDRAGSPVTAVYQARVLFMLE